MTAPLFRARRSGSRNTAWALIDRSPPAPRGLEEFASRLTAPREGPARPTAERLPRGKLARPARFEPGKSLRTAGAGAAMVSTRLFGAGRATEQLAVRGAGPAFTWHGSDGVSDQQRRKLARDRLVKKHAHRLSALAGSFQDCRRLLAGHGGVGVDELVETVAGRKELEQNADRHPGPTKHCDSVEDLGIALDYGAGLGHRAPSDGARPLPSTPALPRRAPRAAARLCRRARRSG